MAAEIPDVPQEEPVVAERAPVAKTLAYGGMGNSSESPYSYRLERGFPFQRAGKPVTVSSTFAALKNNTGSAVGIHQPVNQNALTNGLLDPSKQGFLQLGSNVPTFITVAFTFNATSTTALTISWPATPIRRANRQSFLNISSDTAIPAGSISITSLTANTSYWYYPFWSEAAKTIGWAGAGNSTSAGSPAIAQTAQSDAVLQQQSFQGYVPINVLKFTQPAAGTSTATGGYASGNPDITGGGRSYRVFT